MEFMCYMAYLECGLIEKEVLILNPEDITRGRLRGRLQETLCGRRSENR